MLQLHLSDQQFLLSTKVWLMLEVWVDSVAAPWSCPGISNYGIDLVLPGHPSPSIPRVSSIFRNICFITWMKIKLIDWTGNKDLYLFQVSIQLYPEGSSVWESGGETLPQVPSDKVRTIPSENMEVWETVKFAERFVTMWGVFCRFKVNLCSPLTHWASIR